MKIFVISLKSSTKRRKSVQSQMEKFDLKFEFFNARNIMEITNIDKQLATKKFGRELANTEFACALSHNLLYKKIIDEKITDVIILEDDCILTNKLNNFINMEDKSDFVLLYHYRCFVDKKINSFRGIDFHSVQFMPFATVGYYLNQKSAKILYNANNPISSVADYPIALNEIVNVSAVNPRIIQHPKLEQQTTQTNRKKSLLWNRLRMLLFIGYINNRQAYGSLSGYIKRTYLCWIYKCISPKVEGK